VALTAWFAAYAEPFPRRPRLWQAVAWIALGLAFLSKGPTVLLTAVVPLLLWPRLAAHRVGVAQAPSPAVPRQPGTPAPHSRKRARSRRLARWAGPALFLAVALPWPVAVALVHPPALDVWWGEIAWRSDPTVHHLRPIYYYVFRLPVALFPWIFLTIGGGISVFRRGAGEVAGQERSAGGRHRLARAAERLRRAVDRRPLETYALLWLLGAVACWSLVGQKKVAYLLPAVPAAALLAAGTWRQWHREYSLANSRVAGLLQAGLHGLVAIAAGGAIWFRPGWWPWCVILVAVHLIGGGVLLWSAFRRRLLPGIVASVGAFVVLALVVSGVLTPDEVHRPRPLDLAHRARGALDADSSLPVYFLHFKDDAFIYALDAPTAVRFVIFDLQPGHDRWQPLRDVAESDVLLVARAADWATAPPDLAADFREIARQEHFGAKGFDRVWVDNPGTPTLLLTNRPQEGT